MPRYATFPVPTSGDSFRPDIDELVKLLQPGDRIVSVYPLYVSGDGYPVLYSLVELRHPSWVAKRIGYDTEEPLGK